MELHNADVVIVGAGVIGLAVARALAIAGRDVLVIEAEPVIGAGASSRNSEVIHGGLYYRPGSLKARLCVEGRKRLYRYCDERCVPHRRLGKLIVATEPGQEGQLSAILETARASGIDDLTPVDARQVRAIEPRLRCVAALLSPSTGIIDSHALMLALQAEAQAHGAQFAFNASVLGGEIALRGIEIEIRDHASRDVFRLAANSLVNCAGLDAPGLAAKIDGFPGAAVPRQRYARGSYFSLRGRAPFSRLIYPVPVDGGLGVHLTLDLSGAARFGPDVEWIEEVDYRIDPRRADAFYAEIRRYWPDLPDGALLPGYAGVRPKISGPNEPPADFRIEGPRQHGVHGVVNLFGIESPGLTACLAIAQEAAKALDGAD